MLIIYDFSIQMHGYFGKKQYADMAPDRFTMKFSNDLCLIVPSEQCSSTYHFRRNSKSSLSLYVLKCLFGVIYANFLIRVYKGSHFSAQIVSFCYTIPCFIQNMLKIGEKRCHSQQIELRMCKKYFTDLWILSHL